MMKKLSSGCGGSNEEVVVRGNDSCGGRQGPCGQVASGGTRHIGSGHSPLGSVLCDSRKGRMLLGKRCSIEGGGRGLGGMRIL